MTAMISAPAKLNLTLSVGGHRADGYHELESWVVPIALADTLTISSGSRYELNVTGDDAVPADASNLVSRAVERLADAAGVDGLVRIALEKRIPAGAGLGGGSSDAAACLLALNDLWGLDWPSDRLGETGALIGSDVPLFLMRRQVVMRGRGERVEPCAREIAGFAVLICPPIHLSTASVYRAHRAMNRDAQPTPWESPDLSCDTVMPMLFNDLEPAAFALSPELRSLHRLLDRHGDRCVRMSGSGSALFTLFDDADSANAWAHDARQLAGNVQVSVQAILDAGAMRRL